MNWYHATSTQNAKSILLNGFNKEITNNAKRFGNGVYFSNDIETIGHYGNTVIVSELNINPITFTIDQWNNVENTLLRKYGNEYREHIEEYIYNLGYDSLIIQWLDNTKEITVFNPDNIDICSIKKTA
jgi:hypothetical protein